MHRVRLKDEAAVSCVEFIGDASVAKLLPYNVTPVYHSITPMDLPLSHKKANIRSNILYSQSDGYQPVGAFHNTVM